MMRDKNAEVPPTIEFGSHDFWKEEECDCQDEVWCYICDGHILDCKKCGQIEDALEPECPDEDYTPIVDNSIRHEVLNRQFNPGPFYSIFKDLL